MPVRNRLHSPRYNFVLLTQCIESSETAYTPRIVSSASHVSPGLAEIALRERR